MSKGFAEKLKLLCTLMCAVMVFCALLAACSSDDADVEAEVPAAIGWDYFDNYDPIGKTYEEISGQYGSLEEEGVYDGGVTLRVDGADLYFGFPCYSKDEIQAEDTCTSVYGTLKTVFGLSDSYASDELGEILSVTWDQEYEGMYSGYAKRDSGSYVIRLDVDNINELYGPDTGVAVFIYDESGQGTDEGADASGEELSAYTHVELHPVDSSLISGIGYDSGQNILAVEIRESQELLYYYDVPEEVYNEFNAADPIDDYFYKNIKDKYISVEQR